MKKLVTIEEVFGREFQLDKELIGKENCDKFSYIYKNNKEIYFVKHFEQLSDYDEIIRYEDYILDYQYKVISNNNFIAYNLNFILITSGKIDDDIRIRLERDKYTCRKIVLNEKNLQDDIYLLPFLKKTFPVGEIGGHGDEILIKKCSDIYGVNNILSIVSKEKVSTEDIKTVLTLLDGE